MAKKKVVSDLSLDDLRWLLVEKRRAVRQERLDEFRHNGRVVRIASELEQPSLDYWQTTTLEEPARQERPRSKRILDGFLLAVEISAVIGLIYILFSGISVVRELNREVVSIVLDAQPTLTPTPLIGAVVLPSGHTPPDMPGGARFNESEIPPHLLPFVQSLSKIPPPTPGPAQANRIQIPAIRVDAPVVQGDGWEQLKKGVGQYAGSANPGEYGNVILSAHNDIFGQIFRELENLRPGDLVILYTNQRAYTYVVTGSKIVEPTAVEFLEQTNQPTVTLISCYPYMKDDQRIVVTARLQTSQ